MALSHFGTHMALSSMHPAISSTELGRKIALVAPAVGQLAYFHFDGSFQVTYAGFDLVVHKLILVIVAFVASISP